VATTNNEFIHRCRRARIELALPERYGNGILCSSGTTQTIPTRL
jgi:hypothetical protein